MPEQSKRRILSIGDGNAKVLVIDDCKSHLQLDLSLEVADILLKPTPYLFTTSVRCEFNSLPKEALPIAISRCSVWTRSLTENRLVILSTFSGLKQLKVETDRGPGSMFRNNRLGLILQIPPLLEMDGKTIEGFRPKAQRLLREARLI
jgi:hypothetical protein